jgi:predicted extracellular nuclease
MGLHLVSAVLCLGDRGVGLEPLPACDLVIGILTPAIGSGSGRQGAAPFSMVAGTSSVNGSSGSCAGLGSVKASYASAVILATLLTVAPAMASTLCERPASAPANLVGLASPTPEKGERIRLRGTVSARFLAEPGLDGFYLQATAPAGRPAGVFVYAPDLARADWPTVGREVIVAGRAGSYRGRAQLEQVGRIVDCGPGRLRALPLALPLQATAAERARDVLVTLESPRPLVVTGNDDLHRYGSLSLSLGERLFHPHSGVEGGVAAGLLLDDGAYHRYPQRSRHGPAAPGPRVGAAVGPVTGVLVWAFDAWRVHPVERIAFTERNPRPSPPPAGGDIRVVGYNVENYFLTLGSRGARDEAELAQQRRELRALVMALDPDVLALQEVEKRPAAVRDLVAVLNAGGAGAGPFAAAIAEQDRPGGVIRNLILYREDRLQLRDVALLDDPIHERAPVAASFETRGGREFAVVAVHFKSKGGCRADTPRGSDGGCWARRRLRQADSVAHWLPQLRARFGHGRLLLTGDLNSQPLEPPARRLREAGLIDLLARDVPASGRYTYVFDGRSGVVDHALAWPDLAGRAQSAIWHVNADEPRATPGDLWGQSDHDPVVVDLRWRDAGVDRRAVTGHNPPHGGRVGGGNSDRHDEF